MCGIFFSLGLHGNVYPEEDIAQLLRDRGPDFYGTHHVEINRGGQPIYLTFISTVLSLRGDHIYEQPLVDSTSGSVLCWNGEAWKIGGERVTENDTVLVFGLLRRAVEPVPRETETDVLSRLVGAISQISGPFSFVFYDGFRSRVYYGRDVLGRRSLLSGYSREGVFEICSVCDNLDTNGFEEIQSDGIRMIDIEHLSLFHHPSVEVRTVPGTNGADNDSVGMASSIPPMNKSLPLDVVPILQIHSPCIQVLDQKLRQSVELRVRNIPDPPGLNHGAKVGVLFSGGLDCTILARLTHEYIPSGDPIDLLNVAFENPRVAAASKASGPEIIYEKCPDRITGRASHAELQQTCPSRRWNFVAINIPYKQTLAHRPHIIRLMRPHNTEMDLSIACALYFAARGQGESMIQSQPGDADPPPIPYITSTRILLSGLGADEIFAGYNRHSLAYNRHGFAGLVDELNLDVCRLGKRNLGRDDRVLTGWRREVRYPYLDEEFFAWALACPVWEKCGFGANTDTQKPAAAMADGRVGEENSPSGQLDAEKMALRLLAVKLGMSRVAAEKKRAIQFGARSAKMESGRRKGTQALS